MGGVFQMIRALQVIFVWLELNICLLDWASRDGAIVGVCGGEILRLLGDCVPLVKFI
jgi:hypothetical protein